MGDDFNKVLILADYGSLNIAKKVHSQLAEKNTYGGLEDFDDCGVYINLFNNGEIDTNIKSSIRGRHVFLIKSFNVFPERWPKENNGPKLEELAYEPNQAYMELFLLNDALKRGEPNEITNILPHMPYQRQDRRPRRKGKFIRGPISSKVVVDHILSKADRIITLDSHFKQFESIAENGINDLDSFPLFVQDINENYKDNIENMVFVAPDLGSAAIVERYAKYYNRPTAIINKRREEEGQSEVINIISDMQDFTGMSGVLIDDLIDTGGSIIKASKALRSKGIEKFITYCTHPVLSNNAAERIKDEEIELVTTDSIRLKNHYDNIRVINTASLFAEAMDCICNGKSISQRLLNN